jgi:hypothetical protein
VTVVLVWDSNGTKTVEDYIITCNFGNKTTFAAWHEKNIWITALDLRNYLGSLPEKTKQVIIKECAISETELYNKMEAVKNGTDSGENLYDITRDKVEVGNDIKAIGFVILSVIIVIIIFEIIKRIFYYIVLGSFRPPK